MNKFWHEGTPTKSGQYIVTYRMVFTRGLNSEKKITEDRVTALLWNADRGAWDTDGNHGFCYPVLAWRRLPRAYRPTGPVKEQFWKEVHL